MDSPVSYLVLISALFFVSLLIRAYRRRGQIYKCGHRMNEIF